MGLVRSRIPHPAKNGELVHAFPTRDAALRHLEDHVLTAPECLGWRIVLQGDGPLPVALENPDSRWTYARDARATRGESAQPLYQLYESAAKAAARDAQVLDWSVSTPRGATLALGLSGVLVVVDDRILQSAMLPGQGSAKKVARVREQRRVRKALPRESAASRPLPWRARMERRGNIAQRLRQDVQRLERLPEGSEPYYLVFRPCIQAVRCHALDASSGLRRATGEYGLLKRVLPPMSQLKYDHWQALRLRCIQKGESR